MKRKKQGLTIIEMLVVLGIIATIAGLLIPATQAVRRYAKNTQQQVQLTNISVALEAWKNDSDLGKYPTSSTITQTQPAMLSGAQNLATALMGLDLRGYHPATRLGSSNVDTGVINYYLNPGQQSLAPDNVNARREHYLDITVARPFRLGNDIATNQPGLFDSIGNNLLSYSYVLCDVFDYKSRLMPITDRQGNTMSSKTVKVGSPILYYRANGRGTRLYPETTGNYGDAEAVYQYADNADVVDLKHTDPDLGTVIPAGAYDIANPDAFYDNIRNPSAPTWTDATSTGTQGLPYRRDTYLLISAGADGIYGTSDDVTNFGN